MALITFKRPNPNVNDRASPYEKYVTAQKPTPHACRLALHWKGSCERGPRGSPSLASNSLFSPPRLHPAPPSSAAPWTRARTPAPAPAGRSGVALRPAPLPRPTTGLPPRQLRTASRPRLRQHLRGRAGKGAAAEVAGGCPGSWTRHLAFSRAARRGSSLRCSASASTPRRRWLRRCRHLPVNLSVLLLLEIHVLRLLVVVALWACVRVSGLLGMLLC
jgi:hypothetical protein